MDWSCIDIRVNNCGHQVWPSGFELDAAWFREKLIDYDFWFVWQGQGFFQMGAMEPVPLRRGMCLFLRPADPCKAWQREDAPLGVAWIHFDILSAAKRTPSPPDALPFFLDTPRSEFYEGLTTRIFHLWQECDYLASRIRPDAQRFLSQLMRTLMEGYAFDSAYEATDALVGVDRHHRKVVTEALGQLHARYREIRSITQLATSLGYSRDHFCRLFTSVTGTTPHRAWMRIRMDRARDLLRHSELSVSAIAERIGYDSVFPFSRQFKREVGCSPMAYRRK